MIHLDILNSDTEKVLTVFASTALDAAYMERIVAMAPHLMIRASGAASNDEFEQLIAIRGLCS